MYTIFRYCFIGWIKNPVKFINISTKHILQCNQSEPIADASGRIVDLMNENALHGYTMSPHNAMSHWLTHGLIRECAERQA